MSCKQLDHHLLLVCNLKVIVLISLPVNDTSLRSCDFYNGFSQVTSLEDYFENHQSQFHQEYFCKEIMSAFWLTVSIAKNS